MVVVVSVVDQIESETVEVVVVGMIVVVVDSVWGVQAVSEAVSEAVAEAVV